MTNYIKLKSILAQIPKALLEQSDESDFLTWMVDALRFLPTISYTEPVVEIFELVDGRVKLPSKVKTINMVHYMKTNPTESDISSFGECLAEPEPEEYNSTNLCRYSINYKLFLDSPYFMNNFQPLKYKGVASNPYVHKHSPNRFLTSCANSYTVDKNKVLYSDLDKGFLVIDYDTELEDCNGDVMIPDYQEVREYLAKYSIMKHWEERLSIKEESAFNIYQKYQQESEMMFKRAKGEILLRNTDLNTIAKIIAGRYKNLIQIPELYIYGRKTYRRSI